MPLTRYTVIDHPDLPPSRNPVQEYELAHVWHSLKRGDQMPGIEGRVIVGFWRGWGGMYAAFGPSVNEVSGQAIIKAATAKNP